MCLRPGQLLLPDELGELEHRLARTYVKVIDRPWPDYFGYILLHSFNGTSRIESGGLLDGWVEYIDPASNKHWWWHAGTKRSTMRPPIGEGWAIWRDPDTLKDWWFSSAAWTKPRQWRWAPPLRE